MNRLFWILLAITGFLPVTTKFYWVLLDFTGFYWILLCFTGFYWVLLDFTGFYATELAVIEFYGLLSIGCCTCVEMEGAEDEFERVGGVQ